MKLRAATASQEVPIGPFLDSTDGNTPETALTIAAADILLHKRGATALVAKNSGGATHMAGGVYYAVLDATDTDTVGSLALFVHVAGALACKIECEVLPANVYDSLVLGTDWLPTTGLQANFTVVDDTLTVKKQDGSTTQFTKSITATPDAEPITALG